MNGFLSFSFLVVYIGSFWIEFGEGIFGEIDCLVNFFEVECLLIGIFESNELIFNVN